MKLKENIAKHICLVTICLFIANLAFSSFNFSFPDTTGHKNDKQLKFSLLAEDPSNDSFLFEKEPAEENEDLEEYILTPFLKFQPRYFCKVHFKQQLAYSHYKFLTPSLAKWLEVRHILI